MYPSVWFWLGSLALRPACRPSPSRRLQKKSQHLGKLDENEVMRVNPRTGTIQKSNGKIPLELHSAAMASGAKEISPNTVVYKHAGKMYMFDSAAAANNQAAINFQSQFDDD